MLKVTHLSSFDRGGGAARAGSTLHKALSALDVDHQMLVLRKDTDDLSVQEHNSTIFSKLCARISLVLDLSLVHRYYHTWDCWSLGVAGNSSIVSHPMVRCADIISLSWTSGFLGVKAIAGLLDSGKPMVWTLYDMWSFTGGCHYSAGCTRYTESCGNCPQLGRKYRRDFSGWVWKRKHRQWKVDRLTVVCPSRWLADCAQESALFQSADIRIIPSGIDTEVFYARGKRDSRVILNLPQDKPLILFIASHGLADQRKGGVLLEQALLQLSTKDLCKAPGLVLLGGGSVSEEISSRFSVHQVNTHTDEELSILYSACDVLIAPSKEDNLPLTVLEAMACKTPCVAFRIGGMPDVIKHHHNGYLATPFDIDDLAEGIYWLLCDRDRRLQLGKHAVQTIADGFTAAQEAQKYLALYREKLADTYILQDG